MGNDGASSNRVGISGSGTSVELFAGAGGLAQAISAAGFRPLLYNEWDKRAAETLVANGARRVETPSASALAGAPQLVVGDVRAVDFSFLQDKRVDLLAGGPPCQPFSLGGAHRGHEDERNGFPEFFRALREIRPKAFLVENVRGLLRPSFRPYFEYIQHELSLPHLQRGERASWIEHDAILRAELDNGSADSPDRYSVKVFPVNAADYGVPQVRNRVMMVGFRSDLGVDIDSFAEIVKPTHSFAALVHSMKDGSYWRRHAEVPDWVRDEVLQDLPEIAEDGLLPWRTLRDAIRGIDGAPPLPSVPDEFLDRVDRNLGGFSNHVGWPGARIYPGHTPNVLDRPAKTVKAGVHGVPGGESVMQLDSISDGVRKVRYMTVRETARVMTFPDDWVLAGPRGEQMRQLGNAVPVRLGSVFARGIRDALEAAGDEALEAAGDRASEYSEGAA